MSVVSEIITQDQIQDLWGCGFTIVARNRHPDPFFVPSEMVPQGRAYQWWHLVHDKFHFHRDGDGTSGWAPVPASRHDGYFMPFGHVGDIEVQGLGLFEKSKFEVDQERAQTVDAAQQLVTDWAEQAGAAGLSGSFKVDGIEAAIGADIFSSSKNKTIETTVKIPKDMVPHMAAIFEERDRLAKLSVTAMESGTGCSEVDSAVEAYRREINDNQNLSRWPALHALVLPLAIANVRKSLKQEVKS